MGHKENSCVVLFEELPKNPHLRVVGPHDVLGVPVLKYSQQRVDDDQNRRVRGQIFIQQSTGRRREALCYVHRNVIWRSAMTPLIFEFDRRWNCFRRTGCSAPEVAPARGCANPPRSTAWCATFRICRTGRFVKVAECRHADAPGWSALNFPSPPRATSCQSQKSPSPPNTAPKQRVPVQPPP